MLMRLPLLTHVQKSRGQRQGIGPNPQGHTCSSLHCCGILPRRLHFYSPSNSPRVQRKTGAADHCPAGGRGAGERQRHRWGGGWESEYHCSLSRVARPLLWPTRCCQMRCQSGAAAHAMRARRARSARKTPPRHFHADAHSSACARRRISAWWHRRRSPLKPGPLSLSLSLSSSLSHGSRIKTLLSAT